ncbi:MAG: hypothetical protein KF726_20515 [Anaerolineae bacterium]|nr:hypothetical protein [Anaerolineae bacterium]
MRRRIRLSLISVLPLLIMAIFFGRLPLRHVIASSAQSAAPQKKLIHVGWDTPTVAYLQQNLGSLQDRPFDGLAFKLNKQVTLAFENRVWTESELHLDVLPQITWGRYNENFLLVWGQSNTPVNWFDDQQWAVIDQNTRLLSKVLQISGAKGIFFDPEFYFSDKAPNLWAYNATLYPSNSFDQVQAQVRKRGAAYISALQSEQPTVQFLSLWGVAIAYMQSNARPDVVRDTDFALLPAFLYGVLDGLNAGSTLIDGNEFSYAYDDTTQFAAGYEYIRYATAALVPPAERDRYVQQVRIAASVYADHVLNLDDGATEIEATEMRLQWMQHNVYHALITADQYAWMWNERLNWWGYDTTADNVTLGASNVPTTIIQAIESAKQLYAQQQPLGYDIMGGPDHTITVVSDPKLQLATQSGETIMPANTPITLTFTVSDPSWVFRVDIFANNIKIGETHGRGQVTVGGLTPGTYTLLARAMLTTSQHVTSNPVVVQVQ